MSSRLLASTSTAIALTAVAIIVILFATNLITIANAQQQPQQTTNQTAAIENITFQSTRDSFRVQVPDGWIIQDVDNTGFSLLTEVLQGYGILAQLCPEQEQQTALRNIGSINSCQASQQGGGDIIHIIRYTNLGARLGLAPEDIIVNSNDTLDNILAYQTQKLQEVGYRDIQIVNNTYTTLNIDIDTAAADINNEDNAISEAISNARVPAKLVEITYTTDLAPDEMKRGYFILTATNATPRNLGMITGYSIFYEGNSAAAAVTTASAETTPPSGSLPPPSITPLPTAISQVFDSFELIAGEEAIQDILAVLAAQAEQGQQLGQVEETVTVETVETIQTEEVIEESITPLSGELIASDTEAVAPATIEFEANMEGGLEPYTYSWDFGDGSGEGNEQTVSHTYDEAGIYTVTATVTDSAGQVASGSLEITVEEPPATPTEEEGEETMCDPSDPDDCVPPSTPPPDPDCPQISDRNSDVVPQDRPGFDRNDIVECENGSNQDDNSGSNDPAPDDNSGSNDPAPDDNSGSNDPAPDDNSGSNDNSGSDDTGTPST